MVVRGLIICNTCGTPITTRIWVGHNPYQQHTFLCPNCKEEITLGMHVDEENVTTEIRYVENCSPGDTEGKVINLSPHFVLNSNTANTDRSFSWMEQATYILRESKIQIPQHPTGASGPIMLDIYQQLGGVSNITEMWKIIKKGWSLFNNEQYDLSHNILKQYHMYGYSDRIALDNILYDFCIKLLIPRKVFLFEHALVALKSAAKANRHEFLRFRSYYLSHLRKENLLRYFELFSEYFRDYAEHDQTILYIKNNVPVPDGCVATSSSFKHTKMFYGNAFEIFTSNISVLACINNIIDGRDFDAFKEMNLIKYLTINKANRANPFKDNQDLNGFTECIDSTLRNASHHGATKLTGNSKYIEYRSGVDGAKKTISYSRYLERCGNIMLSSAALLLVELTIASSI